MLIRRESPVRRAVAADEPWPVEDNSSSGPVKSMLREGAAGLASLGWLRGRVPPVTTICRKSVDPGEKDIPWTGVGCTRCWRRLLRSCACDARFRSSSRCRASEGENWVRSSTGTRRDIESNMRVESTLARPGCQGSETAAAGAAGNARLLRAAGQQDGTASCDHRTRQPGPTHFLDPPVKNRWCSPDPHVCTRDRSGQSWN